MERGKDFDAAAGNIAYRPHFPLPEDFVGHDHVGAHGAHERFVGDEFGDVARHVAHLPRLYAYPAAVYGNKFAAFVEHEDVAPPRYKASRFSEHCGLPQPRRRNDQGVIQVFENAGYTFATAFYLVRNAQTERSDVFEREQSPVFHHSFAAKPYAIPFATDDITLGNTVVDRIDRMLARHAYRMLDVVISHDNAVRRQIFSFYGKRQRLARAHTQFGHFAFAPIREYGIIYALVQQLVQHILF